jgi:hypothetical protein
MSEPEIPQSDSIQELAQFWDTHDLTDFEDDLEEIPEPVFERRTMPKILSQAGELHMTCFPQIVDDQTIRNLPIEKRIAAFFQGTLALSEFADKNVCPVVQATLQKTDHEKALTATYYRMCLFLRALAKLDDGAHFQVAAMAARSIFELLLDLKVLAEDPTLARKFFDFTWVSRYRKAKQLVDFLQANPNVDPTQHQHALALVNKPGVKKDRERICRKDGWVDSKGKPKCPDHWSGKNIATRAKEAGIDYEEIYRSEYFLQSYYVHAGGAGIDSMSHGALGSVFACSHALVQRLFAEATRIMARAFHLFEADESLRERLEAASVARAYFAVQAAIQQSQTEKQK